MASKKKQNLSIKRYGTRYGRTVKAKAGAIETLQRTTYKCPQCHYTKVGRLTKGIWQCSKCNHKFTSKAYTVTKTPALKGDE